MIPSPEKYLFFNEVQVFLRLMLADSFCHGFVLMAEYGSISGGRRRRLIQSHPYLGWPFTEMLQEKVLPVTEEGAPAAVPAALPELVHEPPPPPHMVLPSASVDPHHGDADQVGRGQSSPQNGPNLHTHCTSAPEGAPSSFRVQHNMLPCSNQRECRFLSGMYRNICFNIIYFYWKSINEDLYRTAHQTTQTVIKEWSVHLTESYKL